MEVLTHAECLRLLASAQLGRVGVSISALPTILPVNYALLGDSIVFRTTPGTKLSAALRGTVVAFEVDDTDGTPQQGWSVVVVGRSEELLDAATLHEAQRLPLEPWAPGPRDHWFRIQIEHVSGRRIGPAP